MYDQIEVLKQRADTISKFTDRYRYSKETDKYLEVANPTSVGVNKQHLKGILANEISTNKSGELDEIISYIEDVEGVRCVYGEKPLFTRPFSDCVQHYLNAYRMSKPMREISEGLDDITINQENIDLFELLLDSIFNSPEGKQTFLAFAKMTIFEAESRPMALLLLRSKTRGLGKTLLCSIIARIVGKPNYAFIGQADIQGTYSDFLQKRYVVINDIGKSRLSEQSDDIKAWITDEYVSCNEKYKGRKDVENTSCWMATTNEWCNLSIMEDERRLIMPDLHERKLDPELGRNIWALISPNNHSSTFLRDIAMYIKDAISDTRNALDTRPVFDNETDIREDMVSHHITLAANAVLKHRPKGFISREELDTIIDELVSDGSINRRYRGLKKQITEYLGLRLSTKTLADKVVKGYSLKELVDKEAEWESKL